MFGEIAGGLALLGTIISLLVQWRTARSQSRAQDGDAADKLSQASARLAETYERQFEQLRAEQAEQRSSSARREQRIEELEIRATALQIQLATEAKGRQEDNTRNAATIAALQATIAGQQVEITAARAQIADQQAEIAAARARIVELEIAGAGRNGQNSPV